MRSLKRDKQPMKYALYLGSVDVVSTDYNGNPQYYIDSEENVIYIVTGEKRDIYDTPREFESSIGMSGSAESQSYGFSTDDISATLIIGKKSYPIVEGTLIWKDSEVEYDGDNMHFTKDMQTLIDAHSPKKVSADYVVVGVDESLNFDRIILKAINK